MNADVTKSTAGKLNALKARAEEFLRDVGVLPDETPTSLEAFRSTDSGDVSLTLSFVVAESPYYSEGPEPVMLRRKVYRTLLFSQDGEIRSMAESFPADEGVAA